MASFDLRIKRSAEAEFLDVPFPFRRQLNQRLRRLKSNPYPTGCRRQDELGFCVLEVHGWRVIYTVNNETRTVTIERITR